MTLDELKEFLKDANNQSAFDELVKALGYQGESDVAGLKASRDTVLKEKRVLADKYNELKNTLDNIDMDEYNALKDKASKAHNSDELAKIQREFKKLSDEFTKVTKAESDLRGKYHKSIIEKALNDAIDSAGFDPRHKSLLSSAHLGRAKIEIDGDRETVVIDNGDGLGLPAQEFFKTFSGTDAGKTYLRQPDNKGAGSPGSMSSGAGRTLTRAQLDQLPPLERAQVAKDRTVQIID